MKVLFFGMLCGLAAASSLLAAESVDFNRDIRPILANHCWNCHGPDEKSRQAGLRLDQRDDALSPLESGGRAIVPGDAAAGTLMTRISAHASEELMPPPSFQRPLSERQIETLRRWITEGAPYAGHWAFQPIPRKSPPDVQRKDWVRNDVDRFVLAKLENEGLSPAQETDRPRWLRRVTLDLSGLPPTLTELDAFLVDDSPSAYETVVDRLLSSPRHAEQMAIRWLDAARFADTNGYNNDEVRTMWPWRDWVIRAFQDNMPYDRFLTEQLAGDLLPSAAVSQQVATGFVRNHVLTTEGGIIEEEYHVEYVADRVHTVSTVFLALSLQCARCHDHKFDPLTQRDFYRFAAYFNNVPDRVVSYNQARMAEPLLKVPSPEQETQLAALAERKQSLETALQERRQSVIPELLAWEKSLTPERIAAFHAPELIAHFPFEEIGSDRPIADTIDPERKAQATGELTSVEGKIGRGLQFGGNGFVDCGQIAAFEGDQAFSLTAWVRTEASEPMTVLSKMDEGNSHRGYDLILEGDRIACHIVHHWPDDGFKVITKQVLPLREWHHLSVVYDGSRQASGVAVFVNGNAWPVEIAHGRQITGTLLTDKPFHIGRRNNSAPFRGLIDDVQIFSQALTQEDAARLARGELIAGIKSILDKPSAERTIVEQERLLNWYLARIDEPAQQMQRELHELPAKVQAIDNAIPRTMVMMESSPRRPSYVLNRGQYDQRLEEVSAGTPTAILPLPDGYEDNRLGLARWFTHPEHPLTARVAVNRLWEMYFGAGIVETSEDFGVQGAFPSHPELLDWLAAEFISRGWNQRAILRMIALSATYRQSSFATPEGFDRDPHNRLLARGPRHRLPAEMLRDGALFVSGLLKEQQGGPSVKPYQPEGLWEDVSVERRDKYVPDADDGIYRRSMYTFWKRTCPPPGMTTFDAPDREFCLVRRARTNTPLQALVTLNDPTYVEAARRLAEQVPKLGDTDQTRIRQLFRTVVAREPTTQELEVLLRLRQESLAKFQHDPAAAEKLLAVGRAPRDATLPAEDVAAWAAVCSIVLNLSEALTKP